MTLTRPDGDEDLRVSRRRATPASPVAQKGHGGPLADGPRREAADARIAKVDAFVQRHFTWPGTLRLHRAALGADILRAPINVLMSPIWPAP